MRYLLGLVLVVAVLSLLGCSSSKEDPAITHSAVAKPTSFNYRAQFNKLEQSLAVGTRDPSLATLSNKVRSRLPIYLEACSKAFPNAQNLKLDFILQWHLDQNCDSDCLQGVSRSQATVKRILQDKRYSIVGYEGSSLARVTMQGLDEEQYRHILEEHYSATRDDVARANELYARYDGVLQYLQESPGADILGIEDDDLWQLHDSVLTQLRSGSRGLDTERLESLQQLADQLRIMRSLVALAKIIEDMQRNQVQNGVIVMGFSHGQEFFALIQQLGVASTIYNAFSN